MTWKLSGFHAGDRVEVRSKDEILATLDREGCVDGLPFMPEMLQFCGRQFRVSAIAHKTCDTIHGTGGRRLSTAVHLTGVRCNGSAHGDCQADCNLFWKDAWLKPVANGRKGSVQVASRRATESCTENDLLGHTRLPSKSDLDAPRFSCQTTKLFDATEPLAWWDLRQYVLDVVSGNHSAGRMMSVLWLAMLRWALAHTPVGYRLMKFISQWMHQALTGRGRPTLHGKIARGMPTPIGRLDLKPGELVRIKSQALIEESLDETGRNRGLTFDSEEMAPYCGRVFRVRGSVCRIIDESTGKMRVMKQPCITLEDVVCNAEYSSCRLNCPRAIFSFWRELWLERVGVVEFSSKGRAPLEMVIAGRELAV